MKLSTLVWTYLDKWFPPPTPPAAPKRPQVQRQRATPAITPSVTYEAWKAGKMGYAPKIAAPRGYGRAWADRLYCEQAISRAKYHIDTVGSTRRQLRTGSKNDRRRVTDQSARRAAWGEGLAIAEAVYHANIQTYGEDKVEWGEVKDIVRESFEITSYMLAMCGD